MEQVKTDLAIIKQRVEHVDEMLRHIVGAARDEVKACRTELADALHRITTLEDAERRREGEAKLWGVIRGFAVVIVGAVAGWLAKHLG